MAVFYINSHSRPGQIFLLYVSWTSPIIYSNRLVTISAKISWACAVFSCVRNMLILRSEEEGLHHRSHHLLKRLLARLLFKCGLLPVSAGIFWYRIIASWAKESCARRRHSGDKCDRSKQISQKDRFTNGIVDRVQSVELVTVARVYVESMSSTGGNFDRHLELLGVEVVSFALITFAALKFICWYRRNGLARSNFFWLLLMTFSVTHWINRRD